MIREKIHVIIPIAAALVISIGSFFSQNDFQTHVIWLIVTIIVFYFIGLIVRHYLNNNVFAEEKPEAEHKEEQDETHI